jgi:NAD(P)-dependent dehydrogenase (short-subunit alcohol dehydrogenase family)
MLEGKVVVVTGGASGIGLATCEYLLECGANVSLWDLDTSAVESATRSLDATGKRCRGFVVTVTRAADVEAGMTNSLKTFGSLHGAFNNAGIGAYAAAGRRG